MKAEAQVTITNPSGLHARPAAVFVETAGQFSSKIEIMNLSTASGWADAREILNILLLGVEQNHRLALRVEGDDARAAVDRLVELLEKGLLESDRPSQRILRGIPASPGIAIAPVFLFDNQEPIIERIRTEHPGQEWERLGQARAEAVWHINQIAERVREEVSAGQAEIFKAYRLYLEDARLLEAAKQGIFDQGWNAASAWSDAVEQLAKQFEQMAVEEFRLRAVDVRDAGQWVLRALLGYPPPPGAVLPRSSIVAARDLTPADTVRLDRRSVRGFCTSRGAPTSHTAILARAMGLPAVVGLGEELLNARTGEVLVMDGNSGEVILSPDEAVLVRYREEAQKRNQTGQIRFFSAGQTASERRKQGVEVLANASDLGDAREAKRLGADGIGLLRTEFLFLGRTAAPDEEEQTRVYRGLFDMMKDRPVTVRTLDAGGDKDIPYLNLGDTGGSFLGTRGIRACLERPELFKTQLRALLRAGAGYDLRMMFPVVTMLEEVRQARKLLEEARGEAAAAGHALAEYARVGMMVETPAAALLADVFARAVDFFSIGSNDLTQYTLAADRTDPRLAHLNDACHPAVLRQIDFIVRSAHQQGIRVGVCGEMAGDPTAIAVLLAMGVDELSMAPGSIPAARQRLRQLETANLSRLVEVVLKMESAREVRTYLQKHGQG